MPIVHPAPIPVHQIATTEAAITILRGGGITHDSPEALQAWNLGYQASHEDFPAEPPASLSAVLVCYWQDGLQWGIEPQNEERQLAWPNETYEAELDPYHFAGDIRD
jgi:hypothetical protein